MACDLGNSPVGRVLLARARRTRRIEETSWMVLSSRAAASSREESCVAQCSTVGQVAGVGQGKDSEAAKRHKNGAARKRADG